MKKEAYKNIENYKIKTFIEAYEIWLKISNNPYNNISRDEILAILSKNNNDITERNKDKIIERANNRFKHIFCLDDEDYKYNRSAKKYYLINTKNTLYQHLYNYLNSANIIHNFKDNLPEFINAFQFEYNDFNTTVPIIFKLIKAIANNNVIQFKHHNYFNGETHLHQVEPWFIKPYNGKFYLGCYRLEKNEKKNTGYRHFTVSQIDSDSFEILDIKVDMKRKENSYPNLEIEIFDKCIGLRVFREDKPKEKCLKGDIVIETNYTVGKEWINNPKHPKQVCIKENENSFQFLFKDFYFNTSMKQLILQNINNVKLLEPKEATNELKKDLINMLTKYNEN